MGVICSKAPCEYKHQGLTEVSWRGLIHKIKQGYWCMPCCYVDENIHPKMKSCMSLPTPESICHQQNIHGRCGVEFNP